MPNPVTISQPRQVRNSETYTDTISSGSGMQSGAVNLQDDLNALRSQVNHIIGVARWTDVPPINLETIASGSSGLTAAEHAAIHQLIHFIDDGPAEFFSSGAYKVTAGTPFPSSETWYVDSTLAQTIVAKTITRNANTTPSTVQWQIFGLDGVSVLATVSDAISYSGVFETSRTRTIS